VAGAEGSVVFDAQGRRYVDFVMGWCVGNLGWNQRDLQAAIKQSRSPAYVHPSYFYEPWVDLAELLASIAPGKLKKSFRATSGTEAVELAMQMAMMATQRRKFLSIEGSYHGNSIGALSIGSSEYRGQYRMLFPGCLEVDPPLDKKAVKKVARLLKRDDIAAFIMELREYAPDEMLSIERGAQAPRGSGIVCAGSACSWQFTPSFGPSPESN
jgi:4-aminobutyrate aminotransferase-like enzyme